MYFIESKYTNWYNSIIFRAKNRVLSDNIYTEKHHIIPKSLGGNNTKDNLAKLTAREHFICHWLLTKMVSGKKEKYQMWNAFSCMLYRKNPAQVRYKVSSYIFEIIKITGAKLKKERMAGTNNPMYGKCGPLSPVYGKKRTPDQLANLSVAHKGAIVSTETRAKLSQASKGKPKSKEHCLKVSQSLTGASNPMYGKKLSQETIAKRTATLKNNKLRKKIIDILDDGMVTSTEVGKKKNANLTRLVNGNHPSQQKRTCHHCNITVGAGMFGRWHSKCNQGKEN